MELCVFCILNGAWAVMPCAILFCYTGRWEGSALRIVGSACDQLGLLISGSSLPLELEVHRVSKDQTYCK